MLFSFFFSCGLPTFCLSLVIITTTHHIYTQVDDDKSPDYDPIHVPSVDRVDYDAPVERVS